MTDQQRTARIEFVKKLLVANGFMSDIRLSHIKNSNLYVKKGFLITIKCERITLSYLEVFEIIILKDCIKPLRDFIKLSNQK